MAKLGSIEQFNIKKPQYWVSYKERVEFYLDGNAIEENQRKAVFLSICGPELFELARSLCAPVNLKDIALKQVWEKLDSHFVPSEPEIARRIVFERCNQDENESAAEYIAKLREIAKECNFEDKLEERLRDRLVGGIKDQAVQKRLLMEKKLTLTQAIQLITTAETSDKHVTVIRNGNYNGEAGSSVQAVQKYKKNKQSYEKRHEGKTNNKVYNNISCFRCQGPHTAKVCKFKEAKCNFCKKTGHIAKACFTKRNMERPNRKIKLRNTHQKKKMVFFASIM